MDSDPKFSNLDAGLYVVATPLGNLSDLSPRAIEVLHSVDLILTEDTRRFSHIADRHSITTKRKSFFEHNETPQVEEILKLLKSGKSLALVSDAGTPLIADPGYRLVSACKKESIPVSTVPGPCAAIAALSISGLPSDQFFFKGFAPQKSGKRKKFLDESLASGFTCVIYETPHRIRKTLAQLVELEPERRVFLARELTKKFEQTFWGTAQEVQVQISELPSIKGEFVLVIGKPNT